MLSPLIDELSSHHGFRGFPVVCDRNEVLGFVVRIKLREWLGGSYTISKIVYTGLTKVKTIF